MGRIDRTLTREFGVGLINVNMLTALAFVVVAVSIKNVFEININQYVLVFIAAAIMPFLSYRQLLCYGVSIIPFAEGMNSVILWILFAFLIYKCPQSIKFNKMIYALLLLLIEFVNLLIFDGTADYKLLFFYSSYLLLFFYITFLDINSKQAKGMLMMYLLGLASLCLIIVARIQYTMSLEEFIMAHGRIGFAEIESNDETGYLNINPNSLGYYSIVGLSMLLATIKYYNISFVWKITLGISFVIAGALTVSRTWIIILVLCLVWFFLQNSTKIKYWIGLLITLFVIIQFDLLPYDIVDSFEERFHEKTMATGGGRSLIFEQYNDYMAKHIEKLPFGVGTLVINEVVKASHSPHNGTQQIIVGCGIIGFLIFFAAACRFYRKYIQSQSDPIIMFMPFIAASLFLQSIQFLSPFSLILPLAMTTLPFKIKGKVYQHK